MGRQTRTLCVFFEKGKCRNGAACRFTHGASDTRELESAAGGAAKTAEATATPAAGGATTSTGKPCKYFAKGKCTRGNRCPFLHSRDGEPSPSAGRDEADEADEEAAPMVVAAKRPAPGGALSSARSCPSPRRPSLAASAAAAAAAEAAARVAAAGKPPPTKPPPRGGSSSRQKVVAAGGPAGTWADVVTRTKTTTGNDTGSAFGGQQSSTGASTSGIADEEMPAAGASAAASAVALKAARKTEKKAARAAAAAAAAENGTRLSAVEPATTGRRLYQPHQQQGGEEEDPSLSGTVRNGGDGTGKKKTKQLANAKPCVFFPRGRCRYGDGCRFSHDVVEKGGNEGEVVVEEEEEEVVVVEACAIAAKEAALDKAEKLQSRRAECAVCLEVVRKVGRAKDRTFGILVHCRHVFCLKCITEWRNKSKSDECPECQVPSPFVVPSRTLVTDRARKERLVSKFRRSSVGGGGVPFSAKPSSGFPRAVIDLTTG